ncbi:hypothetical protein Anapl_15763 [Anas platyrhynchos]|uniref:Uncharacterized protein n=1 Tax=Anas platyrhynchos TaxID=8839 RepID=R0L222_ANAPL|nr:hypothetical protein Anapl_15763 [Anas platyrhynchos]
MVQPKNKKESWFGQTHLKGKGEMEQDKGPLEAEILTDFLKWQDAAAQVLQQNVGGFLVRSRHRCRGGGSKLPSWYARPSQHATARSELAEVPATSCLVQQICRMQELKMYRTESFGNTMGSCQKDTGRETEQKTGGTDDRTDKMESITQNKTIAVHLIEKKEEFQQLNVA